MPDPMAMPTPGFIPAKVPADMPLVNLLRRMTARLPQRTREKLWNIKVVTEADPEQVMAQLGEGVLRAPVAPRFIPAHEAGHFIAGQPGYAEPVVKRIGALSEALEKGTWRRFSSAKPGINVFTSRLAGFGGRPGEEITADLVAAALSGQQREAVAEWMARSPEYTRFLKTHTPMRRWFIDEGVRQYLMGRVSTPERLTGISRMMGITPGP